MIRRNFSSLAYGLVLCTLGAISVRAHTAADGLRLITPPPAIWLAPLSSQFSADGRGEPDVLSLLNSTSGWDVVARTGATLKLYSYFVEKLSDEELSRICEFLRKSGLGLALEVRALDKNSPCGSDGGDWTLQELQRIQSAGGDVVRIDLDEPLLHTRFTPNCKASQKDIAADISTKIAHYKLIYPNVQVGDIETVAVQGPNSLSNDDIVAFLRGINASPGGHVSYFHADVVWTYPWVDKTRALMHDVHGLGLRFGVIYNGLDFDRTDATWASNAIEHASEFESSGRWVPDEAIFQTWVAHPSRALPESDPNTLTGLAVRYIRLERRASGADHFRYGSVRCPRDHDVC